MNEVGYENDYDGRTDMWWQDDDSWWEDQSWFEPSQVWKNGEWDESWDTAWCGEGETWDESWSWPAIEDGPVDGSAGGTAQGVQSLVLSPLISDVFTDVFTGLVFATDNPSEYSDGCTHFSIDENCLQCFHFSFTMSRREQIVLHMWELHDHQ